MKIAHGPILCIDLGVGDWRLDVTQIGDDRYQAQLSSARRGETMRARDKTPQGALNYMGELFCLPERYPEIWAAWPHYAGPMATLLHPGLIDDPGNERGSGE